MLAACSRGADRPPDVSDADRARGAALIGELKKSLLGAVTRAMAGGVPAAIDACHAEAPALTAAALAGWQLEAIGHFEQLKRGGTALANQSYARVLPDGRVAYAEPLVIQDLCVACHGGAVAPDVKAVLAARYPDDRATGYAVGDLRGVAWVELPPGARK